MGTVLVQTDAGTDGGRVGYTSMDRLVCGQESGFALGGASDDVRRQVPHRYRTGRLAWNRTRLRHRLRNKNRHWLAQAQSASHSPLHTVQNPGGPACAGQGQLVRAFACSRHPLAPGSRGGVPAGDNSFGAVQRRHRRSAQVLAVPFLSRIHQANPTLSTCLSTLASPLAAALAQSGRRIGAQRRTLGQRYFASA